MTNLPPLRLVRAKHVVRHWYPVTIDHKTLEEVNVTIILKGRFMVESRGVTHALSPTKAIAIPPHTWYSYIHPHDEPCETMVLHFSPLTNPWYEALFPENLLQYFALSTQDMAAIENIVRCCRRERTLGDADPLDIPSALLYSAIGILLRSRTPSGYKAADPRLLKVHQILRAQIGQRCRVSDLARASGFSESALREKFLAEFGRTPKQESDRLRLLHAEDLLAQTDLKLEAIAHACGFANQQAFSKFFRQHIGVSPGAWRRGV